MKTLLLVILIALTSCQHKKPAIFKKDISIIGKWTICQVEYLEANGRRASTNFFACSTIEFEKVNLGYFKNAMGAVSTFNWTSDGDNLVIENFNKNSSGIIFNGTFEIIHKYRKEFKEVDLLDSSKRYRCVLGQ